MQNGNLEQEAKSFIGKKGPAYLSSSASKEEQEYFEGTIYKNGLLIESLVSYFPLSVTTL